MRRFATWLRRVFHPHEWVTVEVADLFGGGKKIGVRYILRCKVCGEVVKRDMW